MNYSIVIYRDKMSHSLISITITHWFSLPGPHIAVPIVDLFSRKLYMCYMVHDIVWNHYSILSLFGRGRLRINSIPALPRPSCLNIHKEDSKHYSDTIRSIVVILVNIFQNELIIYSKSLVRNIGKLLCMRFS